MSEQYQFQALGRKVDEPNRNLEVFPAPKGVSAITFTTDEFTSHCPVTGQPNISPMNGVSKVKV